MSKSKGESLFWGVLILIIGFLFLMRNFGWDINLWHFIGKYWPLILIYIGVKNIFLYIKRKS